MGDVRFWVKRYTDAGLAVIPVPRGEKGPRLADWQKAKVGTYDPDAFAENDNIGVLNGDVSGGTVDADFDAIEAITAARVLMLQTPCVFGRPGKPASHLIFRCPGFKTIRYTAPNGDVLLELRGNGTQTIYPPSLHGKSGETIAWEQEREPMPVESAQLIGAGRLVATAALVSRFWPKGARHEAAGALAGFLAAQSIEPTAIERLVRVVAEIAGDEEASDRARFAGDTARKASPDVPTTGGTKLAELIGDEPVKRLRSWFGVRTDGAVEELNRTLFFVKKFGSDVIIGNESDEKVVFQTASALRLTYANELIAVGEKKNGDDILKTKFDVWISSPRRRQYEEVGFYPPPLKAPETHFNLWRGFAVQPDPNPHPEQRCGRFLEHVRSVICGGSDELHNYILDWMTDCVLNPGKPGEVAIAMRGVPGAGKGFFARGFGELFGRRHYIQIDRTEHLTGKFNAHLSGKVVVFADEAIWAGSKQDLGPLKRLITEPTLTIERKGIDAIDEHNCVHLITATNEGWSVPAMLRERRWLVLNVVSSVAQNHAYFEALKTEIDHGGRAALLGFLLARRVTQNLRVVPKTDALLEQKIRSFAPVEEWWFEKLQRGFLFAGVSEDGPWPEWAATNNLHIDFLDFCREREYRRKLNSKTFIGEWITLVPMRGRKSERRRAALLAGPGPQVRVSGQMTSGKQPLWGWPLPSLVACRRHFESVIDQPVQWDGNEPEQLELGSVPENGSSDPAGGTAHVSCSE